MVSSIYVETSVRISTASKFQYKRVNKAKTNTNKKTTTKAKSIKTLLTSETSACGGFPAALNGKNCMQDLVKKFLDLIGANVPGYDEYKNYIYPVVDKLSKQASNYFDFCLGNMTGADITAATQFTCDAIPYDPAVTMGTIGLSIGKLPCPADTTVQVCFTFDTCGSFGLAFNGGIPACIATLTGVGGVIAPFLNAIANVGFAVNVNNNLVKDFSIFNYDPTANTFTDFKATIRGNLFITLSLSLAGMIFPDDATIGKKKIIWYFWY